MFTWLPPVPRSLLPLLRPLPSMPQALMRPISSSASIPSDIKPRAFTNSQQEVYGGAGEEELDCGSGSKRRHHHTTRCIYNQAWNGGEGTCNRAQRTHPENVLEMSMNAPILKHCAVSALKARQLTIYNTFITFFIAQLTSSRDTVTASTA